MRFKAHIEVTSRPGVLDPEAKAVKEAEVRAAAKHAGGRRRRARSIGLVAIAIILLDCGGDEQGQSWRRARPRTPSATALLGDMRLLVPMAGLIDIGAERTRLGIPITVSTDPRHSTGENPASGILMEGFSQWPDPLGLAATRDEELVRGFGDVARREYLAVGIRTALHPMADLATEPRWARSSGI